MSTQNEEIVKRFYREVIGQGRMEVVDKLFGADYLEHQDLDRDRPGLAPAKAWFEAIEHAFPNRMVVLEDLLTQADLVVARWSLAASHTRPLLGMSPTGRTVELSGTSVFRLALGKIVEGWNVADSQVLMLQLRHDQQSAPHLRPWRPAGDLVACAVC